MLELQNICYEVDDGGVDKGILKNVSLTIPSGKLTVITGPNGGGKSTLARIIAGVAQPTSGKIIFKGEDITNCSITERAQKGIGFAFQQPVRFKGIRVVDLIRLAKGSKKLSSSDACKYLAAVGLCAKDYINREVNASLSGGELKRIEIATVLAKQSELSVFDEPEAGIDLWSFQSLIRVFENLRKVTNGNIMIISHQERILEIADKIIYLKDGVVDKFDESSKIMSELNMRYGCGCAYSQKEGVCNG